jgi:hypothetical protein
MRREDDSDLRWRIGHEHKQYEWPRRAARWSAGVLVAKWAFGGIDATGGSAHGLFASLDQNVRDSLATVATIPIIWPLCGMLLSLFLLHGTFFRAARLVLEGPYGAYRIDLDRGGRVLDKTRYLGQGWRWWLIAGWWAMAVAAGAATTAVAGALLRNIGSAWLAWFLVLVAGWLISRAETAVTVGRYPERAVVPTGQQVDSAMVEWLVNKTLGLRPSQPEPGYVMALLQAFSGRDSAEIAEDLAARAGKGGPFVWAGRWLGAGVAVLIYGMLSTPSVERFRHAGWIGRSFVNLHGVTSVAHDNLGAALAVGGIAFALTPLTYFALYLRFMRTYRFPQPIVRTVLRRAAPAFVRGPIYFGLPAVLAGGALLALVLWLGAAVAVHWNSPVLGAAALLVSAWIVTQTLEKAHRWLYTSGPFSRNIRSKPVKATPAETALPSPPESPQLRTLTGHTGKVNTVAVVADGSWLASGDDDGKVRIWDLADGHCRAVFGGHIGAVLSLALTPDGTLLVSGSEDGKVRVWKVPKGRLRTSLEGVGPGGPVTALAVAVAPDGTWLASGASDATVRIWDAGRRQVRAELWGAVYGLRGLAISPDSTLLAGGTGLEVVIWDVPNGEPRLRLAGHTGVVNAVAFAPDGTWLASTDTDETVRIWDTTSGHLRSVLQQRRLGHPKVDLQLYGGVLSVAISPDSTWLATGGSDGQVRIWAVARGKLRATLTGHTGAITSMALAPDGCWLATGGEDGTVRIWNLGISVGLHGPGPHQSQPSA